MLAVQHPTSALPPSMLSRPSHSRAPSAPVVVRPTPTPGIFSLSKSPKNTQQQHSIQRSAPRPKFHKSPKPAPAQAQPRDELATPEKPKADAKIAAKAPATDKPRGRQQRQAKDKVGRRSASLSSARPGRRLPHQPSPPPQTRIPSQAEAPVHVPVDSRSPRSNGCDAVVDPSDPFLVLPTNTQPASSETIPAKADVKASAFRPPPQLTQRPSGKLAHRRQMSAQVPPSPTPVKAAAAPRRKEKQPRAPRDTKQAAKPISNSELFLASASFARRNSQRRATTSVPAAAWDSFPVCDDSADLGDESDDTPPTTPIRELGSVPSKMGGKGDMWKPHSALEDGPRTAPLSSTFAYPFRQSTPSPTQTPTPGQRRRKHQRVPSEGMFNMSTDESSSEEALEPFSRPPVAFPKRRDVFESPRPSRAQAADAIGTSSSAPTTGYYAGSMFQNSPSPDDLPAPSFGV